MSQTPAYLPVMWIGGYSLAIGPSKISFDRETSPAEKPILSSLEQTEPSGYTAKKLTIEGFLASTNQQAVNDLWNWVGSIQTPGTLNVPGSGDGYFHRPVSVGFFTQDQANPGNLWYSDVGYLNAHFEYQGGYGQYYYPYRFQWIQTNPLQYIATTTTINNSNTTYAFNMSGNDIAGNPLASANGYIAGIQLLGSSIQTLGNAALNGSYFDNTSALVGSLPVLGQTANQLFNQTTPVKSGITAGSVGSPTLTLPAVENSGYQSIARLAVTGSYSITFNVAFAASHLPLNIYLVWVPL